ncbi:DUF1684 domain-containing protein [Pseudonocardia abyssalis]|uniref:DUF1684 domain-containing protein n=1 Tax=Pseudonocardia abyssalis TaxID=2792008 RepID=A0ABS6UV32_9PSEU|nr:DUF1684 domain-containing protein [Pseudonocardia abyssalis]MBW0114980.1 DUF1684 domain-containing protein [Pseudonocardia abyssalis]MBW0136120.1 DUF1684 domain-containing protein [Pseudonocardia abyssalis]
MTTTLDLHAAWDAWHAEREEQLREPHGWLSLTALHWLTAEPSTVDGLPGLWSATADGVVITAAVADGLAVRGVRGARPVDGTVTLHPVDGLPGSLVEVGEKVIEIARRTDEHALRVRDPQASTRIGFTGVPTFDVDERWVVDGTYEPYAEPEPITVDAVVDGLRHHLTAVGVVRFVLGGEEHTLVAMPGKQGGLSLHFRDATNGVSTYPGGRSVQVPDPVDGRVRVDLNRLVNLPCAFTDFATCPLPPAGNVLPVAVEAGEKRP